jgi:hypothetical protein
MAFYNLGKRADRDRMRAERVAELEAVENGTWPRDVNDYMRWMYGRADWAGKMCRQSIAYLDDLEKRIQARDPDLVNCGYTD